MAAPKKLEEAEKLDLLKVHREEYRAPKSPRLLDIPTGHYLAVDGRGEPGGEAFEASVGALYAVAYTLKFASKAAGRDYTVSKLEALWWAAGGEAELDAVPRAQWRWKLMIRRPEFIARPQLDAALAALRRKAKGEGCEAVDLESLSEGRCVQMLHVGPYDQEGDTLSRMRQAAEEGGLAFRGRHHEIYLSDPRRVEPQRLRTILRRPVG